MHWIKKEELLMKQIIMTLTAAMILSVPANAEVDSLRLDCSLVSTRTNDKESLQLYVDRFDSSSVLYLSASDFAEGANGIQSKESNQSEKMVFAWTLGGASHQITLSSLDDQDLNLVNAYKVKTAIKADDAGSALVSVGVCFVR